MIDSINDIDTFKAITIANCVSITGFLLCAVYIYIDKVKKNHKAAKIIKTTVVVSVLLLLFTFYVAVFSFGEKIANWIFNL